MVETNNQESKSRHSFVENLERLVDEAVVAADGAIGIAAESIKDSMGKVRAARDSVVMVRLNKDSLAKIDELVEAGVAASRSEAAAFLIAAGIEARRPLFDKIAEKVEEIRQKKEELRRILED